MTSTSYASDTPASGTNLPYDIVMYGADWCGDCRRAKAWFEANGHDYHYVDLEENPEETERVLERNNGLKRIPVIVFADDTHLVEPSNDELDAKMKSLAGAADTAPGSPESARTGGTVVENIEANRFELQRDGEVVSFATFRTSPAADDADTAENVVVPHVETAPQYRGNGYAAELMEGMLDLLRESSRTITPLCPFAAGHIRENPQHHDLVANSGY